jgi:hypothetical protein
MRSGIWVAFFEEDILCIKALTNSLTTLDLLSERETRSVFSDSSRRSSASVASAKVAACHLSAAIRLQGWPIGNLEILRVTIEGNGNGASTAGQ